MDPAGWLGKSLVCAAGRREFHAGRYLTDVVNDASSLEQGLRRLRGQVARHRATAYLAQIGAEAEGDGAEQLRYLSTMLVEAGYGEDAEALLRGGTVALEVPAVCPVTGERTLFEFFPVAFCPAHGDPDDPLYDPSLATPFLAINTTSDAFSFAMFVADAAERAFAAPTRALDDQQLVELLFDKCCGAWQKMSVSTLRRYGALSVRPNRAVRVSADERWWLAPHQDPAFAEDRKVVHRHEMPVVYAPRICARWHAVLFDGATYTPSRDGQAGGLREIDDALAAL
jgi:hypothetical protein